MTTRTWILLIVGVFSVLLLKGMAEEPPSSAVVTGEEWLSWSPEQRTVFVDAYLMGYLRGKSNACIGAAELFEVGKPVHDLNESVDRRCFRHAKSYSRGADHYANLITEFYREHPEYRNIPNVYLMVLLTDDRYKTADEIYEAAVKGEIRTNFWRYSPKPPGQTPKE